MAKGKDMRSWRCAAIVLVVISLGLLIAVIVLGALYTGLLNKEDSEAALVSDPTMSTQPQVSMPTTFSGLTSEELKMAATILLQNASLQLTSGKSASTIDNYIHLIEDYIPHKKEVLAHLNSNTPRPGKQAAATLFMGAENPPHVADYVIDFTSKSVQLLRTHHWLGRPVDSIEENELWEFFESELKSIEHIIMESYNVSFKRDCGEYCPIVYMISRTLPGANDRYVFSLITGGGGRHYGAFVNAVNFVPVVKYDSVTNVKSIVKLFYNKVTFDDVASLKTAYDNNGIDKVKVFSFSDPNYYNSQYGSPKARGKNFNKEGNRAPFMAYPDGQRFTVEGQHVSYLGWSFDIHFRSLTAYELMDVKYDNERIAYEIGMEDMFVLYAGQPPDNFYRNYYDTTWQLGASAQTLIRGSDCPQEAYYMDAVHYESNGDGNTFTIKDALCVFEYVNSVPLRRHSNTMFAFGLPDAVLIVRQVITIGNYDYVFDYEFHANGIIEIKVSSTGYIQTTLISTPQDFGYKVDLKADNIANMHTHVFNFRIDLDIEGTENIFKKIHYLPKMTVNPVDSNIELGTMYFKEETVLNETAAAVDYDFSKPKHYIIANEKATNPQGNVRGYKISSTNFVKIVVPENETRLNGAGWSKKQLFITKHNENERTTASVATNGNPHVPTINFDNFVNGESIYGEDLVAWVTVGLQHIPVAEDIPVTTTAGKQLTIVLAPFNYYKEDPSISSPSASNFAGKEYIPRKLKELSNVCLNQPTHPFIRK